MWIFTQFILKEKTDKLPLEFFLLGPDDILSKNHLTFPSHDVTKKKFNLISPKIF